MRHLSGAPGRPSLPSLSARPPAPGHTEKTGIRAQGPAASPPPPGDKCGRTEGEACWVVTGACWGRPPAPRDITVAAGVGPGGPFAQPQGGSTVLSLGGRVDAAGPLATFPGVTDPFCPPHATE